MALRMLISSSDSEPESNKNTNTAKSNDKTEMSNAARKATTTSRAKSKQLCDIEENSTSDDEKEVLRDKKKKPSTHIKRSANNGSTSKHVISASTSKEAPKVNLLRDKLSTLKTMIKTVKNSSQDGNSSSSNSDSDLPKISATTNGSGRKSDMDDVDNSSSSERKSSKRHHHKLAVGKTSGKAKQKQTYSSDEEPLISKSKTAKNDTDSSDNEPLQAKSNKNSAKTQENDTSSDNDLDNLRAGADDKTTATEKVAAKVDKREHSLNSNNVQPPSKKQKVNVIALKKKEKATVNDSSEDDISSSTSNPYVSKIINRTNEKSDTDDVHSSASSERKTSNRNHKPARGKTSGKVKPKQAYSDDEPLTSKLEKPKHDTDSSDNEPLQAKFKTNGAKTKESDNTASDSDLDKSSTGVDDTTTAREKAAKVDKRQHSLDSDNAQPSSKKQKKEKEDTTSKVATKSEENKRKSTDEHPRITKLKRCVRAAGLHVRCYAELFADCKKDKQKIKKLEEFLDSKGLTGPITLSACLKFKIKRETEKEVAELDTNNILLCEGRPKRRNVSSLFMSAADENSTYVDHDDDVSDREKHDDKPMKQTFARLKGIVDSDEDD